MDTSEVNRYAPPRAEVGDVVGPDVQPIRLWPPNGRLGRMRYLAYTVGLYIVAIFVAFAVGIVSGLLGDRSAIVASVVSWGVYLVGYVLIAIQRSHDMDWPGWTCIGSFIPLVNLIWLAKGGTPGPNRYGAPAPPNTTGVKIVFWIVMAFIVVGIVAAIALPAAVMGLRGSS